jgi:hypothetical protein
MTDFGIHAVQAPVNSRCSQFIIYNVPTYIGTDMEAGRCLSQEIQLHLPTLTFAHNPHWLVPISCRAGKTASSMVISLPSKVTLTTLGINSLPLFNRICRISPFVSSNPSTQCQKCQIYGHHAILCPKDTPAACAACRGAHFTSDHPWNKSLGGRSCFHHPVHCIPCNIPGHKSSDPKCPSRTKLQLLQRQSINKTPAPLS